jgi:hypothetical protein
MNVPGPADNDQDQPDTTAVPARPAVSRRTLDDVFGDVLPDVTRDELEDGAEGADRDPDRWYRDNRPPHHG